MGFLLDNLRNVKSSIDSTSSLKDLHIFPLYTVIRHWHIWKSARCPTLSTWSYTFKSHHIPIYAIASGLSCVWDCPPFIFQVLEFDFDGCYTTLHNDLISMRPSYTPFLGFPATPHGVWWWTRHGRWFVEKLSVVFHSGVWRSRLRHLLVSRTASVSHCEGVT